MTTTAAAPYHFKLPKIKRPNIPGLPHRENDDNTTDNSTTTVTPDANMAEHDTVTITLSIGKTNLNTCTLLRGRLI